LTQLERIEKLKGMFFSAGWIECFKPSLENIRALQLERCCDAPSWEATLAAREGLNLMDSILDLEPRTFAIEKRLQEVPAEASDVVESQ
jgi:hypothetical protein